MSSSNRGLPCKDYLSMLPWKARLVHEGVVWTVGQATATAAVVALPTTTAALSLYNGEAEGGKSYVILAVGVSQVAGPAALSNFALCHCINIIKPATLPTADIASSSIKNMKARQGSYPGSAIVDLAATVVDDLWKNIGQSATSVVNSEVGDSLQVDIDGAVILPPGGMYSLQITGTSTSTTGRTWIRWAEVQLPQP